MSLTRENGQEEVWVATKVAKNVDPRNETKEGVIVYYNCTSNFAFDDPRRDVIVFEKKDKVSTPHVASRFTEFAMTNKEANFLAQSLNDSQIWQMAAAAMMSAKERNEKMRIWRLNRMSGILNDGDEEDDLFKLKISLGTKS